MPQSRLHRKQIHIDMHIYKQTDKPSLVQVVCRNLGFISGGQAKRFGRGERDGNIWLSNVRCKGDEADLMDCPKSCGGSAAVSVCVSMCLCVYIYAYVYVYV
jgi:hypothetical protein